MRAANQDSWQDQLDHLKTAMIGRRIQRNGSSKTAVVLGVRQQGTEFEYYIDTGDDKAYVPTSGWTMIR